jgi:ATP-dependent DNA helicase PIF1
VEDPAKRRAKVISRMYQVNVKDTERYALRTLLLHVPGPTSFQYLRTVDGVVFQTFKEAAERLHLFESDQTWDDCLADAEIFATPSQMRDTFAYICAFNNLSSALNLWEKYRESLSLDYINRYRLNGEDNEIRDQVQVSNAYNSALHGIQNILKQHGMSCFDIGLPVPIGNSDGYRDPNLDFDIEEELRYVDLQIPMLNHRQKLAYDKIMKAVSDDNESERFIYLDGPGGSGKTFLINAILSKVKFISL